MYSNRRRWQGPTFLPGILQEAVAVKQRKWGWACFPSGQQRQEMELLEGKSGFELQGNYDCSARATLVEWRGQGWEGQVHRAGEDALVSS